MGVFAKDEPYHHHSSSSSSSLRKRSKGRRQDVSIWKIVAYLDTVLFIIFGIVIVTVIPFIAPQLIEDPLRLGTFCGVMVLQLSLGFLTMVALYGDKTAVIKSIFVLTVLLQMGILVLASHNRTQCTDLIRALKHNKPPLDPEEDSVKKKGVLECITLASISAQVVLPNFIHSLVFAALLIVYLHKSRKKIRRKGSLALDPESMYYFSEVKKTFRFAHITVIVEEVP